MPYCVKSPSVWSGLRVGAWRAMPLLHYRRKSLGLGGGVNPLLLLVCLFALSACQFSRNNDPLPTQVPSLDALATSQFMTRNAPPEGFRETVSFPMIDDRLTNVSNWRYELVLSFDGTYTGTPRPVSAETRMKVWFNDLGPERRVVIEGEGELFGQEEGIVIEAVRLGTNTFLIRDGTCLGEAGGDAALVADIRAGTLVGGVIRGVPPGHNATINGEQVWRYDFTINDLNLPQLDFGTQGRILDMRGELWVAPEHNTVIRYYLTLEIENVLIRLSAAENPLPVSGLLVVQYELYDIGKNPNITKPFGC